MKSKILTIIGLMVFCGVVLLPPIIYGYVYPNLGDDSAGHLAVLDLMKNGEPASFAYLAHVIIGYPLVWISNAFDVSIDSVFLWFNYVALALVGVSLYFVMSLLVNKWAGWLAILLVIFCAQGLLFQFYYGQVYNLVSMGIILPWLIYFSARYLNRGKVWQLLCVILLVGVLGPFHACGIYVPFIAGVATIVYVVYSRVKKQKMQLKGIVLGAGIVICSIVVTVFLDPFSFMGKENIAMNVYYIVMDLPNRIAVPVDSYILGIVSPTVLLILALPCVFYEDMKNNVSGNHKYLCMILLCGAGLLLVVTFAKLSFDPWRTALDLATILALVAAVFAGLYMQKKRGMVAIIVLALIVGAGLYHNIPTWFSYTSAVRPVDKEAIAYVNETSHKTYACSGEVAPWIYDRFVEAEYSVTIIWEWSFILNGEVAYTETDSDLIIVRSKPMTPRSDKNNMWYDYHDMMPDNSYELTKTFQDSEVIINIYER